VKGNANEIEHLCSESSVPRKYKGGPRPTSGGDARCLKWTFVGRVLGLTALLMLVVCQSQAQNITYAYDELGRLLAVVDQFGDAGVYNYDKVGNLLSVTNTGSYTVSIFTFTPNNGPVTQSVTIYGDGFSTTPSQNTVTFYNKKTVVPTLPTTVATITVPVPAGTATGPIEVTVTGVGSATSTASFTVTNNQ
jgi:YD repeat-containing protein